MRVVLLGEYKEVTDEQRPICRAYEFSEVPSLLTASIEIHAGVSNEKLNSQNVPRIFRLLLANALLFPVGILWIEQTDSWERRRFQGRAGVQSKR